MRKTTIALLLLTFAATTAGSAEADTFGLTSFDGAVLKPNGDTATQAGSHPSTAFTRFELRKYPVVQGGFQSVDDLRTTIVDPPPGLIGNPQATPICPTPDPNCPAETAVGI